jgi:hypothetical protein
MEAILAPWMPGIGRDEPFQINSGATVNTRPFVVVHTLSHAELLSLHGGQKRELRHRWSLRGVASAAILKSECQCRSFRFNPVSAAA